MMSYRDPQPGIMGRGGEKKRGEEEGEEREREDPFGHNSKGEPPSNSPCRAQGEEETGGVGMENRRTE